MGFKQITGIIYEYYKDGTCCAALGRQIIYKQGFYGIFKTGT